MTFFREAMDGTELTGVNASAAADPQAWKHASARFRSAAAGAGSARRGRMARCRRSRVPAAMTWAPVRVGCSVFLNNRYHDPVLGAFVSVDPLVGKTGHPYLYGDGNPSTLSDPDGLCSRQASINNRCGGGRLIDPDSGFARSKFMNQMGWREAIDRAGVSQGYLANGWLQSAISRIRRAGATGIGNPEERKYPAVNATFRGTREAEFTMTLPAAACSGCTTVSVVQRWADTRIAVMSGDEGEEGGGKFADLAGLACVTKVCDAVALVASWSDPGGQAPDFDTTVYVRLQVLQITLDENETVMKTEQVYVTAMVSWTPAQRDAYDSAIFGEWGVSGDGSGFEHLLPQAGDVVVSSPGFVAGCGQLC